VIHGLSIQNRQRDVRLNTRLLRRLVGTLLHDLLQCRQYELSLRLVSAAEITRLNEAYLGHPGATDVITFDYSTGIPATGLVGDILICAAEAVRQARRFRTSWPAELARYVIHGVLHLLGYDDHNTRDRRRMRKVEDRLLKELAQRFDLSQLEAKP
jgi:probable rRNA maturation factor